MGSKARESAKAMSLAFVLLDFQNEQHRRVTAAPGESTCGTWFSTHATRSTFHT